MCKLVENIPFFKKYSEENYEIIKSCCKYMTLELIEDQNPVMVIGINYENICRCWRRQILFNVIGKSCNIYKKRINPWGIATHVEKINYYLTVGANN